MMQHEHDSAGNALRAMRQGSAGYTPPGDACVGYQTLYKASLIERTEVVLEGNRKPHRVGSRSKNRGQVVFSSSGNLALNSHTFRRFGQAEGHRDLIHP